MLQIPLGEVAKVVFRTKTACEAEQLAIGLAVELEHFPNDPKAAEKVARDHLEEDPKYYTKPMKKDWGAEEAKDRIEEMAKEAQSSRWYDNSEGATDPGNAVGNWKGGWLKGDWKCPQCGMSIGRNLRGQQPFALVEEHKRTCRGAKTASVETKDGVDEISKEANLKRPQEFKDAFAAGVADARAGKPANPIEFGPMYMKGYNSISQQGNPLPGQQVRASVFVLEDDPERITIFKAAFGDQNVTVTKSVKTALDLLRTQKFARVFLDRDLSSLTENGEDVAWQMEKERLCLTTPVVIHSENTRGQKVMARYIGRYHSDVSVVPFRELKKKLEVPGGVKL